MSRLPAAVLLGALLTCSGFAQDLTKKVTFSAPATPAKALLRDLSAATGVPMEALPTTATEIILVQVKDVSVDDLMKRIATAIDGDWEKVGDTYRLGRSPATLQRELTTERAERIADLRRAVAAQSGGMGHAFDRETADALAREMAEQVDKEMDTQAGRSPNLWKKHTELQGRTPSGVLMGRVISTLDLGALVDMPEDTRWVFATTPTRMQRAMPAAAYRAIVQFVQDQATWSAAVKRLPFKPREGMEEDNGAPAGFYGYEAVKGTLAKALLTVYRMPHRGMFSCELMLVDSQGKIISRNGISLSQDEYPGGPVRVNKSKPGPPVTLSPISKRLVERSRMSGGIFGGEEKEPAPMPDDLREYLLHPEVQEPLSTFASDFLFSYGSFKKANLVACVPDALQATLMFSARGEPTSVSALKDLAESFAELKFDESDGWIVVHPTAPAKTRAARMDRLKLGQLVRRLASSPPPTMDDMADLAQRFDNPEYSELVVVNLIMLMSDISFLWEMPNWDVLRFYGSLGQQQRRALRQGASLNLGQLNSSQRADLSKIIFYSQSSQLMVGGQSEPDGPIPSGLATATTTGGTGGTTGSDVAMDEEEGGMGDIRSESTEALPNGLPANGVLTFTIDLSDVAAPISKNPWMSRGMLAQEIGSLMAMKERPEAAAEAGALPDLTKFKVGKREMLTIHIQFTPEVSYQETLTSTSLSDGVVPYAQLPKVFLEAVEKALKEYREAMKDQGEAPPTPPVQGGNPPPG